MVAAIVTLVEITRIGGSSDITCKPNQPQPHKSTPNPSRQLRPRSNLGHVRNPPLLTPHNSLTPLLQSPNLPRHNRRINPLHLPPFPQLQTLHPQLLLLPSRPLLPQNPHERRLFLHQQRRKQSSALTNSEEGSLRYYDAVECGEGRGWRWGRWGEGCRGEKGKVLDPSCGDWV